MRLYYYYFDFKKQMFLNSITQDKRYKNLKTLDLSKYKTSDTLFVIGSGYSLNNITKNQWKEINEHDILGFNFSFLNNDHIPTYYFTEAMINPSPNEFGRSPIPELFYQLYRTKKEEYKDVIKILTDLEPNRKEHFENYGKDLFDDNFYLGQTVNGITDSEKEFKKLIRFLRKRRIFNPSNHLTKLFKFRGTLSATISFGVNLGYKNIILCGIDLNDPRYFYQDKNIYPNLPNFRSSSPGKDHATIRSIPNFLEINKVVEIMNEELCTPNGIKLFIQNPESALNTFIPVYKFD